MQEMLKEFISRLGSQFNRYNVYTIASGSVIRMISHRAITESYEFVLPYLENAVLFDEIPQIQRFAIRSSKKAGLLCEFGVHRGASLRLFAKELTRLDDKRLIHGFDSFEGLEEDWMGAIGFPQGTFNSGGKLPRVPRNARLIKGMVQDTLGPFLDENKDQDFAFIHIDLDTYTPSKFVLAAVKDRCSSGTVILFDELYGYPNWRNHEYKALIEVFDPEEYEFVAFSNKQCAIRIK